MTSTAVKTVRVVLGEEHTIEVTFNLTQWAEIKRAARREHKKLADWLPEAIRAGLLVWMGK
jgi:hypothetical protein